MITWWAVARFVHVLSAAVWVGGQVTLSLLMLPLLRRRLPAALAGPVLASIGKRFGIYTIAAFLPIQVASGVALALHAHVTWASLAEPGYGRTLLTKLAVFAVVMVMSGMHGWLHATHRLGAARALALGSLIGSCVIVLLAAGLAGS